MDHGYVTFNHTWGLRKAFGSVLKEGVRFALGKHSRAQRGVWRRVQLPSAS